MNVQHRTSNVQRRMKTKNQYQIETANVFPAVCRRSLAASCEGSSIIPVSSSFQIQNSMLDVRCSTFIRSPALKQFSTLRKSYPILPFTSHVSHLTSYHWPLLIQGTYLFSSNCSINASTLVLVCSSDRRRRSFKSPLIVRLGMWVSSSSR